MRFVLLVTLAIFTAVAAPVAAQQSVVLSNTDLGNFSSITHDWENVVQNVPNDPPLDGFLGATWETNPNYGIAVSWINSALEFDPAVMNDPFAFAVTWQMTGTDGDTFQNYFPVLTQGGVPFRKVGNFQSDSNGTGPHTQFLVGATAWGETATGEVPGFGDGSEPVDPNVNPDFSSSGAPVRFGLNQWGGSGAGSISPAETARTTLQDLMVTVEWFESSADLPRGTLASYEAGFTTPSEADAPDPTTVGWLEEGPGMQGSGVNPDPGFGDKNAWNVNDNTEEGGQFTNYRRPMDFGEHLAADTFGWVLEENVRMVDDYDDSISIRMSYGTGTTRWLLWLDLDGDDNLVIIPNNGGTLADGIPTNADGDALITTNGDGTAAYHDISLISSPLTGNQEVYVDGVLYFTDINSGGSGENGVSWGSGSSGGQGSANFHSVSFTIVPEPASLGLLFLGWALIAGRRRRR